MPIVNASTGGYPAALSLSESDYSKLLGLDDGDVTYLEDTSYLRASRSGDLVVIYESNGKTYDVLVGNL